VGATTDGNGTDRDQQSTGQRCGRNPATGICLHGFARGRKSERTDRQCSLFFNEGESMSQQLAPHQQRVVDEKRDLDEKLKKLTAFISSESFATIVQDADERGRLVCQEEIMKDYSAVLAERIAEF
jgi:hypothetical protein